MMGTEIYKIDASWAEKLTKKRVSILTAPTVSIVLHIPRVTIIIYAYLYVLYLVMHENVSLVELFTKLLQLCV